MQSLRRPCYNILSSRKPTIAERLFGDLHAIRLSMSRDLHRMKMKISAAVSSLSVRQFFIEASASVVLE